MLELSFVINADIKTKKILHFVLIAEIDYNLFLFDYIIVILNRILYIFVYYEFRNPMDKLMKIAKHLLVIEITF